MEKLIQALRQRHMDTDSQTQTHRLIHIDKQMDIETHTNRQTHTDS